jgi:hypothetical protein
MEIEIETSLGYKVRLCLKKQKFLRNLEKSPGS